MPTLQLTPDTLRAMFPHAPQAMRDALLSQQDYLDRAGLLGNRRWFTYCFANCAQETGGFTIPDLTESSAYSPGRAAQVWPGRFRSGADALAKTAGVPGSTFGEKLFNLVYADRMGNGPPSSGDGFRYRGRGGPQLTGRDEYELIARNTALDLGAHPELARLPINQDQIIGAYWTTKHLSQFADSGNFIGLVKRWNGGLIGYADRVAYLNKLDPIVARLAFVNHIDKVIDGNIHVPIDDVAGGQDALNGVRNNYHLAWEILDVDGKSGPATHAALVSYQSWVPPWRPDSLAQWHEERLDVDGLFGPKTYAAIEFDLNRAV